MVSLEINVLDGVTCRWLWKLWTVEKDKLDDDGINSKLNHLDGNSVQLGGLFGCGKSIQVPLQTLLFLLSHMLVSKQRPLPGRLVIHNRSGISQLFKFPTGHIMIWIMDRFTL